MKASFLLIIIYTLFILSLNPASAQTLITHDTVSGTWNISGSPYIIKNDIRVEENKSLIINPGVIVKFESGTGLTVHWDESLSALGKKDSSILFTSNAENPESGDWDGIQIRGSINKSRLKNCIIEYAVTGITFKANAFGCGSDDNYSEIDSCEIKNNSRNGIFCNAYGSNLFGCTWPETGSCLVKIRHCQIYENGQNGIECESEDGYFANGYIGVTISRNLIYGNENGIHCHGDDPNEPKIINNNILNNSECGIKTAHNTFDIDDFKIVNNIINENSTGIKNDADSFVTAAYNDVWNNTTEYDGNIMYDKNISADPFFEDAISSNYHLTEKSPCIDAGDPESEYDPDGTRADIGALYFHQTINNPPVVINEISDLTLYLDSTQLIRDLDASPVVFSDPDSNDSLSYSLVNSGIAIVSASISGSILTITPVSIGTATISITADDGNGGKISTDFEVIVALPEVKPKLPFWRCLVLDGVDDYAEAADHNELDLGDEDSESITIEAWIKFTDFSSADIISKSGAYKLYTETSTSMGFQIRELGFIVRSGSSNLIAASGATVYGGGLWIEGWHHVAGVYDKTSGEMSLYMDGEQLSVWNPGDYVINNSSEPLIVGKKFNGCIDEMRISACVRYSASKYDVPNQPFVTDEHTRALWHFNEPSECQECDDCCKVNNVLYLIKGAYVTSSGIKKVPESNKSELLQNYPNPFSTSTTIEFKVTEPSNVTITIFDLFGRIVNKLVDRKYPPGEYKVKWNGMDYNNLSLANGVYLVQMKAGENKFERKMLLLGD